MGNVRADTLVFFGATGDLAYKKIFSSLQAMIKRGNLNVPVIGVAKAGWNLEQFHARIKAAVEKHGGIDPAAFRKLISLVRYVDGDYKDPATFQKLRAELKDAQHPAHYLAIPPSLFESVVQELVKSGCSKGSRVVVEKPFGNDLASAQELNRILLNAFKESDVYRIDHYLGKRPVHNMLVFRLRMLSWKHFGIATISKASRSPWRKILASRAVAPFMIRPARFETSCRTTSSRCSAICVLNRRSGQTANPSATKRSKC